MHRTQAALTVASLHIWPRRLKTAMSKATLVCVWTRGTADACTAPSLNGHCRCMCGPTVYVPPCPGVLWDKGRCSREATQTTGNIDKRHHGDMQHRTGFSTRASCKRSTAQLTCWGRGSRSSRALTGHRPGGPEGSIRTLSDPEHKRAQEHQQGFSPLQTVLLDARRHTDTQTLRHRVAQSHTKKTHADK